MLQFERSYFVNSEVSNYLDYRQKKFCQIVNDLIVSLDMHEETTILDFGCATGGLLLEFKNRGYNKIKGTDISYWAIEYGRENFGLSEEELQYYNLNLLTEKFDIILFLDVLEHVPTVEEISRFLRLVNTERIMIRVPVSAREGEPYVFNVSRNDVTHVQCHTKSWWINLTEKFGYQFEKILSGQAIYDSEGVFAGVFRKCI